MEKLLNQIIKLHSDCKNYGDVLFQKLEIDPESHHDEPRITCFSATFNMALMMVELLSHYMSHWQSSPVQIERGKEKDAQRIIERKKDENAQRVVVSTKYLLFISSFSIIEHCIKEIIRSQEKHPLYETVNDKTPSFREIIIKSSENHIITSEEEKVWKFINEVRNCTIHNNTVANRDYSIVIDERTFNLMEGKQIHDKLDIYVFLTQKLIDLTYNWIENFDASIESI